MAQRGDSGQRAEECAGQGTKLGSFLRSLLAGVPWSESATGSESQSFAAPLGECLRVYNSNGHTLIIGEERDDILLNIEKTARAESAGAAQDLLDRIEVVAEESGRALDLDVHIPKSWNRYGSANLELRIPRGLRVSATAANGKTCLQGIRNKVKAQSSNGSVNIKDVVGDIEVSTANAAVCCNCTCGRLTARSSNGKIELSEHSGSLNASTSNGLIRATVLELGNEGIVLATSNGRIVLELPDAADAEVDIRVENGVIRNHRDLVSQSDPVAGRLRGKLGNGGKPIKLRTSNGVISLH